MSALLQRLGLKKKKNSKFAAKPKPTPGPKLCRDIPTSTVSRDAATDIPAEPTPRRSFDSRASGSIISIPRSIDDIDDLKPWKKRRNKGKQAHRENSETVAERMRKDLIVLQQQVGRIEAHVVSKTPPDTFNLDEQNLAVSTNDLRTFIECAMAIYEEGKDPSARTDSAPETPEDIRNAFVNALEKCKDPEFLFKLSQRVLRKYGTTYAPKATDEEPSQRQDTRSEEGPGSSSKPNQNTLHLPQIEYRTRTRHENEDISGYRSTPKPHTSPPTTPQTQLALASPVKAEPGPIPGELVPIATHILRNRINAAKRQRGELMPHLPMPFGPSPPPIDQHDVIPREPKYLGFHDFFAENCIENLETQSGNTAQLPRPYTENVAVERTGDRPQIEATVSKPNTLTKPAEPCFNSSPEDSTDIEDDDDTYITQGLEDLSITKHPLASSIGATLQKTSEDSIARMPLFSSAPMVFPMSFDEPNLDEPQSNGDQNDSQLALPAIQPRDQNPRQIIPHATPEPRPEESHIQRFDTDRILVSDETCVSSECVSSIDHNNPNNDEDQDDDDEEAEAQLSAIHLLILLKVLAKRQNESRGSNQTDRSSSNSSRSPTPSDTSEGSGNSSSTSSSTISHTPNISMATNEGNPGGPSKKRSRGDDGGGDGNDPDKPPPSKKMAIDMIRDVLRRLACPFARGRPDEHQGCQMINRQSLSGVKEHVKRKHFNKVLPAKVRAAKNWNEVFLYCNQNWTGPIPSPYIGDMFIAANDNQPLHFEPSPAIEAPVNDGIYRPIAPFLTPPILGGHNLNTAVSGPMVQPLLQIHNPGNYDIRPKQPEPTIGQGMVDFLATGGFNSIYHLLPPHLQSVNMDELEAIDLENYMQSNFGIDVNQTRSQLMTPEFTNDLNMLFQQQQQQQQPEVISPQVEPEEEEEYIHNNQGLPPPIQIPQTPQAVEALPNPSPPPIIKLHLDNPPSNNPFVVPQLPIPSSSTANHNPTFISPDLSHGLDYLFADSKPYLNTQRPKSRLSRSSSSSSSSSSPPSSSSSLLLPDPGTQTPDTLLSTRSSLDLPPPVPPKPPPQKSPKKKKYSLHIKHKPPVGAPKCATFTFNPDNEYLELKLLFNSWMTRTFFPNNGQFSWDTWELEDTDYHERITSLEGLAGNLPFTWTAFRTTEAAFLLVPKQ
ncbi:hypothetical protein TWF481_002279 [Arthrobotrys musiformis]|uniref:Uncharacterized protein n=1 Tax=Arthrobotrys musiformis TaxID=47236 RepID=A0AAV9VST4_9PEZI